jgi:hypothetical protein
MKPSRNMFRHKSQDAARRRARGVRARHERTQADDRKPAEPEFCVPCTCDGCDRVIDQDELDRGNYAASEDVMLCARCYSRDRKVFQRACMEAMINAE